MSNEVTISQPQQNSMQSYCFANAIAFEAAQRMATALSKATLVPKEYQNNVPNCIIALEVAQRMSASPLMVMQNLYIVHGRPGWSSQFIIAAINTCGRFKPLRFEFSGIEGSDERSCIAWTTEKNVEIPKAVYTQIEEANAKKQKLSLFEACKDIGVPILEGPKISLAIAKKEGWFGKTGSKWQTIPELMLHYRGASFFGKLYAPDVLMGMQTAEEIEDFIDVTPRNNTPLKEAFMNNGNPDVTNSDIPTTNKMDEILSRVTIEEPVEIDNLTKAVFNAVSETLDSPSKIKAEEIICLLQNAESIKAIGVIMKDSHNHMLVMDGDVKNKIWAAREDKLKVLGG